MNKFKVALLGLIFSSPLIVNAGEALDVVNAEVEQRANQIDQEHGVLLTGQERSALKLLLIANKVVAAQPNATVNEKTDDAIVVYEISDPADQRQLLIKMDEASNLAGGGGGTRPPCCDEKSN